MDEAQEIVLDWADDYGLELQNQVYSEDVAEWTIERGRVYLKELKELQRDLYDEGFQLHFEDAYTITVYPF